MEQVLLLGRKDDPHIVGISQELEKLGENYFVLDQFSKSDSFHVKFDSKTTCVINSEGREIIGNQIKSVWNSDALRITADENILEESSIVSSGIAFLYSSNNSCLVGLL